MQGQEWRVADPWWASGEFRTPHVCGTPWPVRVDLQLADGVAESAVDRWVGSACLLCSNGCGLNIAVKAGRIAGVRGRATDSVNHGRLGPKGSFGWQAKWTMVGQAARGLRDSELLQVVSRCEGETATQLKWLRTRMKQAAPQALITAR
jgi:hypothetical protein